MSSTSLVFLVFPLVLFAMIIVGISGLASSMPLLFLFSLFFLNKAQGALEEYAFHDEIIGLES